MYQPDEKDSVEILDGVPQSSIGAPIPILLADEQHVVLAYYLENTPDGMVQPYESSIRQKRRNQSEY